MNESNQVCRRGSGEGERKRGREKRGEWRCGADWEALLLDLWEEWGRAEMVSRSDQLTQTGLATSPVDESRGWELSLAVCEVSVRARLEPRAVGT